MPRHVSHVRKQTNREGKLCAIFEEVGYLEMSASEKSYLSAGKYSSNLDEVEVEEDFFIRRRGRTEKRIARIL